MFEAITRRNKKSNRTTTTKYDMKIKNKKTSAKFEDGKNNEMGKYGQGEKKYLAN